MSIKKINSWIIRFLLVLLIGFISCEKDELKIAVEDNGNGDDSPQNSTLPRIEILTSGSTIVDEPKITASMQIYQNEEITFSGIIGIELRGASSQSFPKKSYGLETRDDNNMDLDVSLLGLPEEEDWILYAPYSDKSLVRNMLMYDISRDMGQYASRCKFVELKLNNNYKGVYVFMEKLKRDKNRINISKLNPDENSGEDITGGYILKIDKTAGTNLGNGINDLNSFPSNYLPPNSNGNSNINFQYEYPKSEEISDAQKAYIQKYISDFEDALSSENFLSTSEGYDQFIDVDSFIDFFIMNELSNNVDGYRLSTYLHKDRNKKLKMGPVWDFNLAYGNADYCSGGSSNVWAYKFNDRCPNDFWLVPFWWERLLEDPNYVSKLKNRWNSLRNTSLATYSILDRIESYKEKLITAGSIERNFSTWPVLGEYIWPNNFVGNTYQEELDYLSEWITIRLQWLDNAIQQL